MKYSDTDVISRNTQDMYHVVMLRKTKRSRMRIKAWTLTQRQLHVSLNTNSANDEIKLETGANKHK